MPWTDLVYAYGSKLTSVQMTQLDDNLDALAAQENSGEPAISLRSDVVTLDMLDTGPLIISGSKAYTGGEDQLIEASSDHKFYLCSSAFIASVSCVADLLQYKTYGASTHYHRLRATGSINGSTTWYFQVYSLAVS